MPELLSVVSLSVRFDAAQVLEDVSLDVEAGKIVGLVGPNGAGKTTTLRAISGVTARCGGEVRLDGRAVPARPAKVAALGIVHVPEGRGLISSLTVRDNLRLACAATRRPFGEAEVQEACDVFPRLQPLLSQQAGLLSGGEAQMAAIARGLIVAPKFLLVDELSLGLAPKLVRDLLATLVEYARERAIGLLLVDQNVRALSATCERLYSLKHGRTSVTASTDDALIRSVYFE